MTVLPPKSAAELEAELQTAHAMIGRLMMLVAQRTDMNGDEILALLRAASEVDEAESSTVSPDSPFGI